MTELFVRGTEPSSTSERFDELEPVSGLTAEYNEDNNAIEAEWNYEGDEEVSFDVSVSIDGGGMQSLSSTEDTSIEISEVETGAEYEIQVIAVSNENDMESEPRTTSVRVPGEDEDEEEEQEENENEEENEENNGGNIPPVNGLSASYNEGSGIIDVTWGYDGPPASFEVSVNGQTQTVESNGIEIDGATPGEDYTINVTPIGQNGANEGIRGDTQSTSVSVPAEEEDEDNEEDEDDGDQEEEDNGDG